MRIRPRLSALAVALGALMPMAARADVATVTVSGDCPGPQPVAFDLTIEFTPTGPGTATVRFTAENTSGLYPFQSPSLGNPLLTGFYFNIPGGASATYTEGALLAGSTLVSSGGNINGVPVPAGCTTLAADVPQTGWYVLVPGQATGQYGIFTSGVSTAEGVKAGLADPEVMAACVPQGDVHSPIYVAGRVRFTVQLANLPSSFDSAQDLLALCSSVQGGQEASSIAGKMQATGTNGEESCFIGEPCPPTPVRGATWGAVKSFYR